MSQLKASDGEILKNKTMSTGLKKKKKQGLQHGQTQI